MKIIIKITQLVVKASTFTQIFTLNQFIFSELSDKFSVIAIPQKFDWYSAGRLLLIKT